MRRVLGTTTTSRVCGAGRIAGAGTGATSGRPGGNPGRGPARGDETDRSKRSGSPHEHQQRIPEGCCQRRGAGGGIAVAKGAAERAECAQRCRVRACPRHRVCDGCPRACTLTVCAVGVTAAAVQPCCGQSFERWEPHAKARWCRWTRWCTVCWVEAMPLRRRWHPQASFVYVKMSSNYQAQVMNVSQWTSEPLSRVGLGCACVNQWVFGSCRTARIGNNVCHRL